MSFRLCVKPALLSLSKAYHLPQEKVKVRTENEKQLQKVKKYCMGKKIVFLNYYIKRILVKIYSLAIFAFTNISFS